MQKRKNHLKDFLFELGIETERNRVVQEKENAMVILVFLQAKLFKAIQKLKKKKNHTTSPSIIVNCGSHKKENTSTNQNEVNIGTDLTQKPNGATENYPPMHVCALSPSASGSLPVTLPPSLFLSYTNTHSLTLQSLSFV